MIDRGLRGDRMVARCLLAQVARLAPLRADDRIGRARFSGAAGVLGKPREPGRKQMHHVGKAGTGSDTFFFAAAEIVERDTPAAARPIGDPIQRTSEQASHDPIVVRPDRFIFGLYA